jgi:hypothetical protein
MDTSVTTEWLKLIPLGRRELMLRLMYSHSAFPCPGLNPAIVGDDENIDSTAKIGNKGNTLRVAIVMNDRPLWTESDRKIFF